MKCIGSVALPPNSYTWRDHRWPQHPCFLPPKTPSVRQTCPRISVLTDRANGSLQNPATLSNISYVAFANSQTSEMSYTLQNECEF